MNLDEFSVFRLVNEILSFSLPFSRNKEDDARILGKRMPESMHVCQVCGCVCVCVGYHAKQQFSVDLAFLFQLNQRQNLLGKHRLVKIIPLLVAFETSASLTVPLAACFLIGPYGRKVAKVWILAGCFGNIIGLSLVILGAMLAILLATYTLT